MKEITIAAILILLFSVNVFAQGGEVTVQIGDTKEDVKYHPNGEKKSSALLKQTQNGRWVPDGLVHTWYPSGKLRGIMSFKMGVNHGIWKSYFENGQQYNQREFLDGKPVSVATTWYENGKIAETDEFTYESDRLIVTQKIYYANGIIKEEGRWIKNQNAQQSVKDGLWIFYKKDGSVLKKENH